jgi:hypothetical protein
VCFAASIEKHGVTTIAMVGARREMSDISRRANARSRSRAEWKFASKHEEMNARFAQVFARLCPISTVAFFLRRGWIGARD